MALANFLDKAALGASQVLKDFDRTSFEDILLKNVVEITFDKKAAANFEGQAILDLLIRLLARLYPSIAINCIDAKNGAYVRQLAKLAKAINPAIDLSDTRPSTVRVVVSFTQPEKKLIPTFFAGSDGWTAFFSEKEMQCLGKSKVPFGAGAAACLATANVFRSIFHEQLPHGPIDKGFSLSLFSLIKDGGSTDEAEPDLRGIDVDYTLVGLGAIGNGCLWALSRTHLSGRITMVDHERISLSNLQRYVLATQDDIDKDKVELGSEVISAGSLTPDPQNKTWQAFISQSDHTVVDVAVCVDSAADRINVQGSLPRTILNAWTQQDGLGISRHPDYLSSACLTCLYLPEYKIKSKSELLAEALGIPAFEGVVRTYLANNMPLDENMMNVISSANGIDIQRLKPYEGKPLDIFRNEFICGGVLMSIAPGGMQDQSMEVPAAFESAFAGILLAAEMTIQASNIKRSLTENITRFNLMRPLTKYINQQTEKHVSGRCICHDPIYQKVYADKWEMHSSNRAQPGPGKAGVLEARSQKAKK